MSPYRKRSVRGLFGALTTTVLIAACVTLPQAVRATVAPEPGYEGEVLANTEVAGRVAEHRLGQIELPPGSTPVPATVGGPLVESPFYSEEPEAVYHRRFWKTPLSARQAIHWFDHRRPAGVWFSEASPGLQMPIRRSWWLGGGDQVLGSQIVVSIVAAGSDGPEGSEGTYVRIDAVGTWILPRPRHERIPTGARIIDLTVEPWIGGRKAPSRRLRITEPAVVGRITELVEGLRIAQGPALPCPPPLIPAPGEHGPSYIRLLFRAAPRGHVLAEVGQGEQPGGCNLMQFSRGGHRFPELVDGGAVLRALVDERRRAA